MRTFYNIFIIGFLSLGFSAYSQISVTKSNDILVKDMNGADYKSAWSGGINAGQISQIDLDFDGKLDLFVFDRVGNKISTFLNKGGSGEVKYEYAPEYISQFPDSMTSWTLLRDYNNDGKADIFTYFDAGTRVYKNVSNQSDGLKFELKLDYIIAQLPSGPGNLYTSRADIPSITDIDGDGDLDVLSFGVQARTVTYYENFAADSNDLEKFYFMVNTRCWGDFEESDLSRSVTLNKNCPMFKAKSGIKHQGSTLTAFDEDRDGDMDLMIGDVSSENIIFLENGGNAFNAVMVSQDTIYPSYATSIQVASFLATYVLDVNNDGRVDLIAAPNSDAGLIDNAEGLHLYLDQNTSGASNFKLESTSFLQNDMIEMGTGAFPALLDYNFDGLFDIVVGNDGYYNGADFRISKLEVYQNTGTATDPKFELVDDDFSELTQLNLDVSLNIPTSNVTPTFADLNADTRKDMVIGDYNGKVHLFINKPKNGLAHMALEEAEYLDIDVGQEAIPQLFDLDGDGLQDLLIGNYEGKIAYYRNTGSKFKPDFTLVTDELGGVLTTANGNFRGYAQPFFYEKDNEIELICGSFSGQIFRYTDVRPNINGQFTLVTEKFANIDVGERSHFLMHDFNGDDQMDFIIGNECGGLEYFKSDFSVGIEQDDNQLNKKAFDFKLAAMGHGMYMITVQDPSEIYNLRVISITGQEMLTSSFTKKLEFNLSAFSEGIYFVQVSTKEKAKTKKLIHTQR